MLLLTVAIAQARPGTGNLFSCVLNECTDAPVSLTELANQRAYQLIDSFYKHRHKSDGFNGCVMVARDGKPIYTGAFGYGNIQQKDTLSLESSFQLASCSKTFTSTGILMLAEQGLLSLDDSVQKFFPDFPYHDITIRLLLSHRTGLPDYINFSREYTGYNTKYLSNHDLMNVLVTKKPAVRCKPDKMFIYCNTNYAILASIIEQASGLSYKKFMHDMIFSPLGMNNTYVYDLNDCGAQCATTSYTYKWAVWNDDLNDGVVGDKGIFSSVEDMLKWDNALRSGLLLTQETMREAYTPRSLDRYSFVNEKDKNYGYGWRMSKRSDKSTLIYHNGFWHGSNNVFARDLKDGYTVIVLGNKSNQNNYWTQPVWEILNQLKMFDNVAEAE